MQINFDHLSPTQFEMFCFDLLYNLQFVNISWRKGTSYESSPSDNGRDIECEYQYVGVDNFLDIQKWFVECKHYKSGVSPDKIMGALSWATAYNPDKLLIMTSGFLSNPTKNFLEEYKKSNSPKFKIVVWEQPKLKELLLSQPSLIREYKLSNELPNMHYININHIRYSIEAHYNTLDYLFDLLDSYNVDDRKEVLSYTIHFVINPRFRTPVTGSESMKELMIDEVSYESFKKKCYSLRNLFSEGLIVELIISSALKHFFSFGDPTSMRSKVESRKFLINYAKEELEKKEHLVEKEFLNRLIVEGEEYIKNIQITTNNCYKKYNNFCDSIVAKLYDQEIPLL